MAPLAVLAAAVLPGLAAAASPRVGDGWGTNIHWTSGLPGEAAMLATAFKVARMDFTWASIEKQCGQYDFSAYDTLLSEMEAAGVRPYWILDYSNTCYGPDKGCVTPSCIAAYGRLASAAAVHFGGHNIIWESTNEPNGMGSENATDIAALCAAAGGAFRAAGEFFVAPAVAGMDFVYLNASFAAGLLGSVGGVSVHPYRSSAPETVGADWATLKALITSYIGADKPLPPLLGGEWGYTSATPPCVYGNKQPKPLQGKFVPRMWLSNILSGVPISIDYDWKNDGSDPTNCEDNFGSVFGNYTGNASAPFVPKPAFRAALAAQTGVGNAAAFDARIPASLPPPPPGTNVTAADVFVLRFSGGGLSSGPGGVGFAAWTTLQTCGGVGQGSAPLCGPPGTDEDACLALGCCFDEDSARCSAPPPLAPVPPAQVCAAAGSQRADCGFEGISHDECVGARGCCWDPSAHPDGPQCFFNATGTGTFNASFAVAPAPDDACFELRDVFGYARGPACAQGGLVTVTVSDGPLYLL